MDILDKQKRFLKLAEERHKEFVEERKREIIEYRNQQEKKSNEWP